MTLDAAPWGLHGRRLATSDECYAKTREYRSSIGNKAARTRQRNLADQPDQDELADDTASS